MQSRIRSAAHDLRADLRNGQVTPAKFNAALTGIAPSDRDAWLDLLWDIGEIPADDSDLPRGCVPYLPCPVASILDAVERTAVRVDDVFVDVGSGLGRAAFLAHLTTGAACIGLEIQPTLARAAQERAAWAGLSHIRFLTGDATELVPLLSSGTVFLLYCPFSGSRLQRFLDGLETIARARTIRVCCVDMPALEAPWLARMPSTSSAVDVYRSTFTSAASPEQLR